MRTGRQLTASILALLLIVLLSADKLPAHETLVLNTPGNPPYHYPDQSGIMDQWMQNAFMRLNIAATLQWLPPERSLLNANDGEADGDAVRIGGLSARYPNLIQVPEKVYEGEFAVFSKKNLAISNWSDLKPYNVGFIKGHKVCEENIREARSLTTTDNMEDLFQLLAKDRVDLVVVEQLFGLAMMQKLKLQDIIVIEPPLARLEFFLYLHKRHQDLVPQVSNAIAQMKNDGSHERIYREGLKRFYLKK